MVKNLPSVQETHVQSLGWEDALEKRIATHNPLSRQVLAWRIPGSGGAWWTTVHGVAESRTQLSNYTLLSLLQEASHAWTGGEFGGEWIHVYVG